MRSDFRTPKKAKRAKSIAPSLKADGIRLDRNHLQREDVVRRVIKTAKEQQFVVLGSSAATGKTSLLQLVEAELVDDGATVVRIRMSGDDTAQNLYDELEEYGITKKTSGLKRLRNTWLLLDDSQNIYDEKYFSFWQFIVKGLGSSGFDDNLFVIIAATYDLETPKSPVNFRSLKHIESVITLDEASSLVAMFQKEWGLQEWRDFPEALIEISRFTGTNFYHIGVIMAGMRLLEESRSKPANKKSFNETEQKNVTLLRLEDFCQLLGRCYKFSEADRPHKDELLDVLISGATEDLSSYPQLAPFIRVGLLNKNGEFSTIAAQWYYNRRCFPDRAINAPGSLDELVKLCVQSISAKQLRDTLVDGFPKEATFQHLFNEALSRHLPLRHTVIPELNTFATDANDPSKIVTGELDFYIHGSLQWALELVRQGSKIGEHVDRFDKKNGKYRTVPQKDFLVVDCRGPKKKNRTARGPSKCTLYFSEDFQKCICQMRLQDPSELELAN